MKSRGEKLLLWILIPLTIVLSVALSPRFLFRQARVSYELNQRVDFNAQLDVPSRGVRIVDYRGRWFSMYAKLRLSEEKYDHVKQRFLQTWGTVSNKDFEEESMNGQPVYSTRGLCFYSELSMLERFKGQGGLKSMNLDDYEELFIAYAMYGAWFTSAGTSYVLVKENSESFYLYVWSYV